VDAEVAVADRLLDALADEDLATAFAQARVLSRYDRETGDTMTGIRREEERALTQPDRAGGVVYAAPAVQDAVRRRL